MRSNSFPQSVLHCSLTQHRPNLTRSPDWLIQDSLILLITYQLNQKMSVLLRMRGVLKRSKGEWLTFLDGACGFVSERCKLSSCLFNRSGSVGVDLLLLENFIKTLQAALTWPCKTSQRGDSGTILKEQKELHVNVKSWTHLTMTTLGFDQTKELERGWEHAKAHSLEVTTGPGVLQTLNSAIYQASVVQRLDTASSGPADKSLSGE